MERFNLIFDGNILPDFDHSEVKKRFARALLIDDQKRVEQFFSGDPVIIRRNLEKEAAEEFYTKMYRIGVVLKLEGFQPKPAGGKSKAGPGKEFDKRSPDSVEKSWPVSAAKIKAKKSTAPKPGNAVLHAEEMQRRAREEEAARKQAEEREAREKAKIEAARIKAEEAAARKKAAAEEARRKAEERAARKKAREEAARRKAKEVAARKKAAEEKARKKAEELEARKKAREEAALKKAEEAAARKEKARKLAEEREAKKKAREEAARIKAEEAAARKKAAEEEARKKAEERKAKKKAREEAARKKAEEIAARKEAARAEARRKAEELEARKKAREEAARVKAEKLAARKEAARKKAEEIATRKRAAEEQARQLALQKIAEEETARELARQAEAARAAEELAQQRAEEEVRARQEKQLAAELEAEKKAAEEAEIQRALEEISHKKAREEEEIQRAIKWAREQEAREKEAQLRAELAEQKRIHAAQAARARAEEERIEQALHQLAEQRQAEQAARDLKRAEENKTLSRRIVPSHQQDERSGESKPPHHPPTADSSASGHSAPTTTGPVKSPEQRLKALRKHPAAPNLFALRPFRNSREVRDRSSQSRARMKAMYLMAAGALLAVALLSTRGFLLPPSPAPQHGPQDMATDSHARLVLQAGQKLFVLDRAGVDIGSPALELAPGTHLVGFDTEDRLVMQESTGASEDSAPTPTTTTSGQTRWLLQRCDLEGSNCQPFPAPLTHERIGGWAADPRTDTVFATLPAVDSLARISAGGEILNRAKIDSTPHSSLVFSDGLLYSNAPQGPAIAVFSPDAANFGHQLDEILLLPPELENTTQARVFQFVRSSDQWWVTLENTTTGVLSLHRFDSNWNPLPPVKLERGSKPEKILAWGNKVLVLDSNRPVIARFNSAGEAEAPLEPEALKTYLETRQQEHRRSRWLWQASTGLLALLGIVCYLLGRFFQLRALVYKRDRVSGAEPIDDKAKQIHWIDFDPKRLSSVMTLVSVYAMTCLAVFVGLVYFLVPVEVVVAAILVLAGPAVALALLYFSKPGHIGLCQGKLVLVDHYNNYHIGGDARIRYWGNFLFLDDVALFIGSRYLPVFSPLALRRHIAPTVEAGIKVDWKTAIIKLIQSSHPLARGLLACIFFPVAAIIYLLAV